MRWVSHISLRGCFLAAAWLIGLVLATGFAQAEGPQGAGAPKEPAKAPGPRLGAERSENYYVGVLVVAEKAACGDITATLPVPIDWPEQTVKVLKEDRTPHVKRL